MANDDTLYFGNNAGVSQDTPTPPVPANSTSDPTTPTSQKSNIGKRAAAVAAAVVGGSAVGFGVGATAANVIKSHNAPIADHDATSDIEANAADQPYHVTKGGLKVVDIDDSKSFNEAFAEARGIVGPGGAFTWHGRYFGTYYDSEWNAMTPEEHAHYQHHMDVEMDGDSYAQQHLNDYTPHHENVHHDHQPEHIVHHHIHHVIEPVIAQAEPAINIDTVNINYGGGQEAQTLAENTIDDVRVLGVQDITLDDGSQVTVGGLQMNGQDVYVVDTDTDSVFDVAMSDINNNGTFDADEVHDISDAHLTVGDLEVAQIAQGDDVQVVGDENIYTGSDIDYTNNAALQVDNSDYYDDSSSSNNDDYYASNDTSYDDSSSYDSGYNDGGYDDGGSYVDDSNMMV